MAIGRDRKSTFSHRYSLDDVRYEKNAPTVRHAPKKEKGDTPQTAKRAKSPKAGGGSRKHPTTRRAEAPRRVSSGSIRSIADRASGSAKRRINQSDAPSQHSRPVARKVPQSLDGRGQARRQDHAGGPARAARPSRPHPSAAGGALGHAITRPATPRLGGDRGNGAPRRGGGSFSGFYFRYLKLMVPLTVVVAVVLGFGIFDLASSWGKVHPGVSVQGVDVGGLSVDDAASKIEDELGSTVDDMKLIVYDNGRTASADGKDIDDSTNSGVAYAATASGLDLNGDGTKDKWRINKSTIGAYIDGHALAEQAYRIGREGNAFTERLSAWVSGKHLNAVLSYKEELFNQLVNEINDELGTKMKNSKAKISGGRATLSEGRDGIEVDQDSFVRKISAATFNQDNPYCTIPMHQVTRKIGDDTAQRVVDEVNAAISQDVTIAYEDSTWTMSSDDLGSVVGQKVLSPDETLVFGNGSQKVQSAGDTPAEGTSSYDASYGRDASSGYTLQAYVDQKKLDKYLVKILGKKAAGGAKSARFKTNVEKKTVSVVPSKNGTGPDRASAELAVQGILFGGAQGDRTVTISTTTVEPELTTEEAQNMGIEDMLSSWSVPLSEGDSSSRIKNIKLLCKLINNSIIAPGETWSFNGTTGERTKAKGFETAPTIVNGRHEDELGGGICQVATCVFNCACWAGLGIGNRANHAFYISAYDDRGFADATVSWPSPDLQWVNDTQHSILLTAQAAEGGYVTVAFWGTDENRKVTCDRGKWKKGDKYKTIKEDDPDLAKGETKIEQTGVDGRSIVIHYISKDSDGNTLHDIEFTSDYSAQNEIIKVGTKTSDSDSGSDSSSESDDDSGGDDSSSTSSDASEESSSDS